MGMSVVIIVMSVIVLKFSTPRIMVLKLLFDYEDNGH